MKFKDLCGENDVQLNLNGSVYKLKLLERETDEDYDTDCSEWCALAGYCLRTMPRTKFCEPFDKHFLSEYEMYDGCSLAWQC